YSVNPDGTDLELLYGANSHATGTLDPVTGAPTVIQFLNPRPMQDRRARARAPARRTEVPRIPGPSPGGRYRSAAPLFDGTNRLLVSWSQCRLVEGTRIVPCTDDRLRATNPAPVEAPPLFGLYVYDVTNGTQRPMLTPQEGFIYTEVV